MKTPEAERITLREFEERFGITSTNAQSRINGYPKASYYRPEDREESERQRKLIDAHLNQ